MILKTALITLVSTLLIAILALRSQENGGGARMANTAAWGGGNGMSVTGASAGWSGSGQPSNWNRRGGTMSITGASGSYSGGGQRGDWGRGGSMSITGASGSFSRGGERGHWGDDRGDDDHDGGWEGGDD